MSPGETSTMSPAVDLEQDYRSRPRPPPRGPARLSQGTDGGRRPTKRRDCPGSGTVFGYCLPEPIDPGTPRAGAATVDRAEEVTRTAHRRDRDACPSQLPRPPSLRAAARPQPRRVAPGIPGGSVVAWSLQAHRGCKVLVDGDRSGPDQRTSRNDGPSTRPDRGTTSHGPRRSPLAPARASNGSSSPSSATPIARSPWTSQR